MPYFIFFRCPPLGRGFFCVCFGGQRRRGACWNLGGSHTDGGPHVHTCTSGQMLLLASRTSVEAHSTYLLVPTCSLVSRSLYSRG